MAYDLLKKDSLSENKNEETGGQTIQMQGGRSNASMDALLGGGASFSELSSILESSSGVSLSDVAVHYNSEKPAAIGAEAYAKGNDVFLGPGQERHLSHELTHVVQQKQGIVEPTGSIGGMPVNTSESLEAAADRMSTAVPPGAVSGVTPNGGVVQGVFLSKALNNAHVPTEDVEAAIKMLEGAYQSHIDKMEEIRKQNEKELRDVASDERREELKSQMKGDEKLLKAYKDAKSSVKRRFKAKIKSDDEVFIEEYLHNELYNAQNAGYTAAREKYGISDNAYEHLSDAGKTVVEPGRELKSEHTRNGLLRDMARFSIDNTVFGGIDDIAQWSPAYDADRLSETRMGGSASLTGNIGDGLQARTATDKQLAKMKKQFKTAAEISRNAALEIRKNKNKWIGFAYLYELLKNLNKSVQEGMDKGGKLRAAHATAGTISSVGQNQLPEDLYRLLNRIGSYIRELGGMKDEKLRRSQAIRVAAYSYQMLISLHPFKDGNGRTCRLFADTILQTFGLPPHTPLTMTLGGTIGEDGDNEFRPQIDFEKGSYAFLYSVRESSRILSGQKRSIPSNYEYLRVKDSKMPAEFATGEGYEGMTLEARERQWAFHKQELQEDMNLDVIERENQAVRELQQKQQRLEEWKRDPALKRADIEYQARQDAYRNTVMARRRAVIKKNKNVNLENMKPEDDKRKSSFFSIESVKPPIMNNPKVNAVIRNQQDRKKFYDEVEKEVNQKNAGMSERYLTDEDFDRLRQEIINRKLAELQPKASGQNNIINNNINNVNNINNNDLADSLNNLINNKEIKNAIEGKELIIADNNDNVIKLDLKKDNKIHANPQNANGNAREDKEVILALPVQPEAMKGRTPQTKRNKVSNIVARTFGYVVSDPILWTAFSVTYLLGGFYSFYKAKKMFTHDEMKGQRQEKRHHNIIPGWNGAKYSDEGQQDPQEDILDDFRRVPTVWAVPIMDPADTKDGKGTKEDQLPPKVTAYVQQPRSYSSASLTGVMECGHAFLGIEFTEYSRITGRNQRYRIKCGFYPARTTTGNNWAGILLGKDTIGVGELVDDRDHGYDISRTYLSTRENVRAMAEKAEKYTEEGGYGWFSRNCVTFLRDTLNAGNLPGDKINKIFTKETFRFNPIQNTGFALAEGAMPILNMIHHNKMARYGTEDDDTYQGTGNKRMTVEEYKRFNDTYNRGGYGQQGYSPASAAENMRRLNDKSLMGSYRHVTDKYRGYMSSVDRKGIARDLLPNTVQELLWFGGTYLAGNPEDRGEVGATGAALQQAIYRIMPREEIEKLGTEYKDFKGWFAEMQDVVTSVEMLKSSVLQDANNVIKRWKQANPNYMNDEKLRDQLPDIKTMAISDCISNANSNAKPYLQPTYTALRKATEDVSRFYASPLRFDARVHKEVMDYLSALQMAINTVEKLYQSEGITYSNDDDLGTLRRDARKKNMTVTVGDWKYNMTPSEYEAYLQEFGSPEAVMMSIKRKKQLDDDDETNTHEYHKLKRSFERAGDYEEAHRYLLNKGNFTTADLKYITDLSEKEKSEYRQTAQNPMSRNYLAIFFESIFGGLKANLKEENKRPLPKKNDGDDAGDYRKYYGNLISNHLKKKADENGEKGCKTYMRILKTTPVMEDQNGKSLAHLFVNMLKSSYLEVIFPLAIFDDNKPVTLETFMRTHISMVASNAVGSETDFFKLIHKWAEEVMQESNNK